MADLWNKWGATSAPGYSGDYYLNKYSDIMGGYKSWLGGAKKNFGHYVRNNWDVEAEWQKVKNTALSVGGEVESRHSWGEKHWNKHGHKENRQMAYNVSPGLFILSRGANDREAAKAFGGWHYIHGGGKGGGYYGTEQAFYDSPGEVKKRWDADQLLIKEAAEKLAAEQAAAAQLAAERAEAGRLASQRGRSSYTQGASGAATFKGKGLKSSENRRGKRGTGQFKRPYSTSPLSIAAGTGTAKSSLNL